MIQKYARRRGESSISGKLDFPVNSKCARRRDESTIFAKPVLKRKMAIYKKMYGVEARARFLQRLISLCIQNVHGVETRARFLQSRS